MASGKVQVPEEIKNLLRQLHPNDRQRVIGVLSRMENDQWREAIKIDFGELEDVQLWGVVHDLSNVTFVEEDDGTVTIVAISARSRFRPTY